MSAFAPMQYRAQTPVEMAAPKLSGDELRKLQEIHELINLLLEQLPAVPQSAAHAYQTPIGESAPYTFALFQLPWGRTRYVPPNGI